MTRGTQILSNSKCPCFKKQDRVCRPYGDMSESRNLFLKGLLPLMFINQNHCLIPNNN